MSYEILKLFESPSIRTSAIVAGTLLLQRAVKYGVTQWWSATDIDSHASYIVRHAEEAARGLGIDMSAAKSAPINFSKHRIGSLFTVNAERAVITIPGKKGEPTHIRDMNLNTPSGPFAVMQACANLDNPQRILDIFKDGIVLPEKTAFFEWWLKTKGEALISWARPLPKIALWRRLARDIGDTRARKVSEAMQAVAEVLAAHNTKKDLIFSGPFHIGLKVVDSDGQAHIAVMPKTDLMKHIRCNTAEAMRDAIVTVYREQLEALAEAGRPAAHSQCISDERFQRLFV